VRNVDIHLISIPEGENENSRMHTILRRNNHQIYIFLNPRNINKSKSIFKFTIQILSQQKDLKSRLKGKIFLKE
jgi:hypothetical protein